MKKECYSKDAFISVSPDNSEVIICKNPDPFLTTWEDLEDMAKRYLYKEKDIVLTPFGIQTIKSIDRHYSDQRGHEWLILVEENGNQYKPCELIGIVISQIKTNNMPDIGIDILFNEN